MTLHVTISTMTPAQTPPAVQGLNPAAHAPSLSSLGRAAPATTAGPEEPQPSLQPEESARDMRVQFGTPDIPPLSYLD